MIRLSVILPMYNVEPYVERCIRSLENQDIPYDEYEIICVNDGSPDHCKQLIERLQREFSNIVLIDQVNQGVSKARNNGMDHAKGKYVLFVDPDDFVDANSLGRILTYAEQQNTQVTFLGFSILDEYNHVQHQVFSEQLVGKVYPGTEAYHASRQSDPPDPDRIWAILFDREFMNKNKLRFIPNIPYLEDGEFLVRIMFLASKCNFEGKSFLQRTTRPGSATHSNLFNTERAVNGFLIAAHNLMNFRSVQSLLNKDVEFINQSIVKFVILSIHSVVGITRLTKIFKINSMLKHKGLGKLEINGCSRFYTSLGRLYNISPFLLYAYLSLRSVGIFSKKFSKKQL
ncbi:glycosyltransferase family 2 protein [Saccharicrinis fermentans]|uniref:Hyaluronan synthase n=1 Tax=Saccharicrinis fermentans DSM 9555 = JCM 21142 TaxID=869213 RepID=W7XXQ1_9BACT|nr:glycosyltransferase [Saccharicrinis fermentans]GAF03245.1 hyaluronan synthase [Saccharicrinis fermentans DSM 9555 = JCM 21142]